MSEIKINAKYKDRLFRWIFSSKKELLDLYNAVRGTNYTDPEAGNHDAGGCGIYGF